MIPTGFRMLRISMGMILQSFRIIRISGRMLRNVLRNIRISVGIIRISVGMLRKPVRMFRERMRMPQGFAAVRRKATPWVAFSNQITGFPTAVIRSPASACQKRERVVGVSERSLKTSAPSSAV